MKNPNLPRFLTSFSVFVFKSHSKWFSLNARWLKNDLQAEKSILNEFWKQKQKKLLKICEDLDISSFKIKIGCLYLIWKLLLVVKRFGVGRGCGSTLSLWYVFLKIDILLHKTSTMYFFSVGSVPFMATHLKDSPQGCQSWRSLGVMAPQFIGRT